MNGDPQPGNSPASGSVARPNFVVRYLRRFDDGEVVRWVFRGLMAGAICVLALDLNDLARENGGLFPPAGDMPVPVGEPALPPAVETDEAAEPKTDPRPFLTTADNALKQPMRFDLALGGVLNARGTIDPGSAARFAAELEARGEYVKVVSLDSPGGALEDAMAMARLMRERGLSTTIADGALCASSCPLFFVGGTLRTAGAKAAIGVHQFYAVAPSDKTAARPGADQAMADAQTTTARITRHLAAMGVDPALWLHALVTPPRSLYYFSAEELSSYRIVTGSAATAEAQ